MPAKWWCAWPMPLTHSVFWGTLAYTLIGGTLAGTVLTLVFLPAMYSIWFKIRPGDTQSAGHAGEAAGPQLMTGS